MGEGGGRTMRAWGACVARQQAVRYRRATEASGAVSLACWTLTAILLGGAVPALAQGDWQPLLQPPQEGEFWRAGDALVLALPEDLPVEVLQRLSLELDNFDVTSFVRRDGNLAILEPPQPLTGGNHSLRLVESGADGSIVERGYWTFEVRKTATLQTLDARTNIDGAIYGRVLEHNITEGKSVTGQSAGEGSLTLGEGGWEMVSTANYLYNSQREQTLTGRQLDLGEYLVTNRYRNDSIASEVNFGHHDVGAQNFIMSGFSRRGVSARLGSASERFAVTGFALRSESVVGHEEISGIDDAKHRLQGAHVSIRPIESLRDNLEITGTAYDGTGDTLGIGASGIEEENSGRGGAVAIDSRWLDERLRLRGEFALSDFDFDGEDQGFEPEGDHAYGLLASYAIFNGEQVGDSFVTWDVGAQHERVGTYFASLANPFVVHDRMTTNAFSNLQWGEYSLQLQGGYQTNNVDDLEGLPTDRTVSLFANGGYTPFVEPEPDGSLPWFGQPTFGVTLNYVDVDQTDIPSGFLGEEGDTQTRGVTFMVGSSYEAWSWTLSQSFTEFDAKAPSAIDSFNSTTDLSGSVTIGDQASISPYVQWNHLDEDGIGTTESLALGFNTTVELLPEVLRSSLNYNVNLSSGANDIGDTHYLGGELLWTLLQAETNRPGVALSLSGSFLESSGVTDTTTPDQIYQVFLGLKLNMPAAY